MSCTNRVWIWVGMAVLLSALFGETVRAQVFWVEEPSFAPPSGWVGCLPEFCDLDGDGDVDLAYSQSASAMLVALENIGTPQLPSWELNTEFLDGLPYFQDMTLCFSDLDADGDFDASAGRLGGGLYYFENIGGPFSPEWEPHHEIYVGVGPLGETFPELADLDGDGDLDLAVSTNSYTLRCYRNTGTPQSPSWQEDDALCAGVTAPYGHCDPNFADIDLDGDLDLVISATWGGSPMIAYENVGTTGAPVWLPNDDLLTGVDRYVGAYGVDLCDIDGDQDIDLLSTDGSGAARFYLNCRTTAVQASTSWGRIKANSLR